MGNNEESRLEPPGLSCVCICECPHLCPFLSITSSEQPIEGLKQSPSENSADYTNDNYVDKDRFCHRYSHYCCI